MSIVPRHFTNQFWHVQSVPAPSAYSTRGFLLLFLGVFFCHSVSVHLVFVHILTMTLSVGANKPMFLSLSLSLCLKSINNIFFKERKTARLWKICSVCLVFYFTSKMRKWKYFPLCFINALQKLPWKNNLRLVSYSSLLVRGLEIQLYLQDHPGKRH